MPEQTAKPIPTQLNIAPRGKTWKNWCLVEGDDGFPTRESMEKFLCNPGRVRQLEECRALNLETIDRLNALLETSKCEGCVVQQGYAPMGAVVQISEATPDALRYAAALECDHHEGRRQAATCLRAQHARIEELEEQLEAVGAGGVQPMPKWATPMMGLPMRKKSGSEWQGHVVGWYSTKLTPQGLCIESEAHPGSVQIYPVKALEFLDDAAQSKQGEHA